MVQTRTPTRPTRDIYRKVLDNYGFKPLPFGVPSKPVERQEKRPWWETQAVKMSASEPIPLVTSSKEGEPSIEVPYPDQKSYKEQQANIQAWRMWKQRGGTLTIDQWRQNYLKKVTGLPKEDVGRIISNLPSRLEAREQRLKYYASHPLAGQFMAGTFGMIQTGGQALEWLGKSKAKGLGLEDLGADVQQLVSKYAEEVEPVDMGNISWKSAADPQFWGKLPQFMIHIAPFSLSLMPAMVVGYSLGAGLTTAPLWSAILGGLGGALVGRPAEALLEAGDTYQQAIDQNLGVDVADKAATSVFLKNLTLSGFDAFELIAALAPIPKMPGAVRFVGGILGAGLGEAAEETLQAKFQIEALGNEFDMFAPEVKQAALGGFIPGALLGSAGGVFTMIKEQSKAKFSAKMKVRFAEGVENYIAAGRTPFEAELLAFADVARTLEGAEIIKTTSAEIGKSINQLFQGTEIVVLYPGDPEYKYVKKNGSKAYMTPDAKGRIEVPDRLAYFGLHELGHIGYWYHVPENVLASFYYDFVPWSKTEAGKAALETEGRYYRKDAVEVFADFFDRIASGKATDGMPNFTAALTGWLVAGAPSAGRTEAFDVTAFGRGVEGTIDITGERGAKGTAAQLMDRYLKKIGQMADNIVIDRQKKPWSPVEFSNIITTKNGKLIGKIETIEFEDEFRIIMLELFIAKQGQGFAEAAFLKILRDYHKGQPITFSSLLPKGVKFLEGLERRGFIKVKTLEPGESAVQVGGKVLLDAEIIKQGSFTQRAADILAAQTRAPKVVDRPSPELREFFQRFEVEAKAEFNIERYQALIDEGSERFGFTLDDLQEMQYEVTRFGQIEVEHWVARRDEMWRAARGIKSNMDEVDVILNSIADETPRVPLSEKASNVYNWAQYEFIDEWYGVTKIKKALEAAGIDTTDINNVYEHFRLLSGNGAKSHTFLRVGTFRPNKILTKDGKFAKTGEPLEDIYKSLTDKGEIKHFGGYLIATRAVELGKKGVYTGIIPAEIPEEIKEKINKSQKLSSKESKLVNKLRASAIKEEQRITPIAVSKLDKEFPHFKGIADRIYKYELALRQYLLDSGAISKELFERLNKNTFYVPLHRLLEPQPTTKMGKTVGRVATAIKRLSGKSERPIINPMESLIKNTHVFLNIADRNESALLLTNVINQYPDLELGMHKVSTPVAPTHVSLEELGIDIPNLTKAEAEEIHTIFRPRMITDDHVLTVRRKGKSESYKVDDPELFKGLLHMNHGDLGIWGKLLGYPARSLRAGAIFNPDFPAKNVIRDQWSAFINANYGYRPVLEPTMGLFHMIKRDDIWQAYYASGAAHSTMQSMDRNYLRQTPETLMRKYPDIAAASGDILTPFRWFSESMENATRIGTFALALEKGASVQEAAMEAKEVTLDFSMAGRSARIANQLIPFFNANVRDWHKFVNMHKNHPIRTGARLIASVTIPSVALLLLNMKDPRWEHIPQWKKDLGWVVFTKGLPRNWDEMSVKEQALYVDNWNMLGTGIWWIPKPFTYGILYGSFPERAIEWAVGKEPAIMKELARNFGTSALPGAIPQAMLPWLENAANYSFFQGAPIVPRRLEGLKPELQYVHWTSETAKGLGRVVNYPPVKIDNLIRGYTAGLGQFVLDAIDEVVEKTGITSEPVSPADVLADIPVIKAFAIRNPYGASDAIVTEMYDRLKELEANEAYLKQLLLEEKHEEYLKERNKMPELAFGDLSGKGDFASASANGYRRGAAEIAATRKIQDAVYRSKELSAEEKRREIEYLDMVISKVAKDTVYAWRWKR